MKLFQGATPSVLYIGFTEHGFGIFGLWRLDLGVERLKSDLEWRSEQRQLFRHLLLGISAEASGVLSMVELVYVRLKLVA